MEVWFYHLQRKSLAEALPAILEKSLQRGWHVVVQSRSEERLDALDTLLWTYADESFLAHGRARDGDAEMQPVYLTTGPENPNGAKLRLFLDGAAVTTADQDYERLILLFDGRDDDELAHARAEWARLKAESATLAYWQETEQGGWEKKL